MFEWIRSILSPSTEQESKFPRNGDVQHRPIWLTDSLANRTQELLRTFCDDQRGQREGVVYWCGVAVGDGGVVTTLVVPNASAGPGHVETTAEENAAVLQLLDTHKIVLLGQAHSHPHGTGVRHSAGDDKWTFSPFEGAVSVVVPDYAEGTDGFTARWGLHRFRNGSYRSIPEEERPDHLRIVPDSVDRRL